jgi:hypothetical protein
VIILGFFLGFVLILQIFVLVGICRTNNKLNELETKVSTLNDLIVPAIGANAENTIRITRILDTLADNLIKMVDRQKKHEKKKDKIYADNMIIKSEKKGAKIL